MPRELQELIQDQLNSFEILDSDPNNRDALWRLFVAEQEYRERTADRAVYWCDRAEHWRQKYIAMRAERDATMDEWIHSLERQMAWGVELAGHREEQNEVMEAARKIQQDRVARELLERIEFWDLKRGVEESDLGLYG